MSNTPEENSYDPWKPGEPIDPDIPKFAGGETGSEDDGPDAYFIELDADAAGEKAAQAAQEHYALAKEEQRKNSPHRRKLSGEKLTTEGWEPMADDD